MKYKQTIIDTVRLYNGKPRVCGSLDCNLMILQIYEPYEYELLKDTYSTIKEGIRVAKQITGYRSIREYVQKSDKYILVPSKNARFGDIGFVDDAPCTFIHLGTSLFGVENKNNKEIFRNNKITYNTNYTFYRRL